MSKKSQAKQEKKEGTKKVEVKDGVQQTIQIKDCSDTQLKSFLYDLFQEKTCIDSSIAALEDELRRRRTPVAPKVVEPAADTKVEDTKTTDTKHGKENNGGKSGGKGK